LWSILLVCPILSAPAAEIRLKTVPVRSTEPLIRLADIADVLPMGNAGNLEEGLESLRQMVLFPAPAAGTTRTLDQWEVRTLLSQLGITSIHHLISGAERVIILGEEPAGIAPANLNVMNSNMLNPNIANPNEGFVIQANYLTPASANPAPASANQVVQAAFHSEITPKTAELTDDIVRLLESQVAQALNVYLNFTHRIERSWDISLKLTPEQIKLFVSNGQIVEITGGQVPFTGIQQFHVRMQNNVTVTVDAMVALPTEVVVVRRALPRGYIINESDVMLQRADRMRGDDFFVDIKSVVGRETTKAVRELSPLTQSDVRKPLWIRKGEIVTVRAVNGGITARTEATALQDGIEGDTITVAKIDLTPRRGKKEAPVTYLARVCAPKTVEVFAQ